MSTFLIYGATGYVGEATARLAVKTGQRPILAGRDALKLGSLAAELGLEYRAFDLSDPRKIDPAFDGVTVLLHCAGPFIHTYAPMLEACLRAGVHYLDLTGELQVYQAIAARDAQAKARGVMLLPGVGFDVVPSDCLALHLKRRLPSATRLTLAFRGAGPAGLPPGTQRTAIENLAAGIFVRRDGRLETAAEAAKTRQVDFGKGPVLVSRLTWGDVFTAYYSTGIPNIEVYARLPEALRRQMAMVARLRPLFKPAWVRNLMKRGVTPGATPAEQALSSAHVWGEVRDDQGRVASARMHGPEPGLVWTARTALAVVGKVLAGQAPSGYQTPAMAFGPDFALECEGVTREDFE